MTGRINESIFSDRSRLKQPQAHTTYCASLVAFPNKSCNLHWITERPQSELKGLNWFHRRPSSALKRLLIRSDTQTGGGCVSQDAGYVKMLSDPSIVMTVFSPTDAAFKALNKETGMTYQDMLANPSYAKQVFSFMVVYVQ